MEVDTHQVQSPLTYTSSLGSSKMDALLIPRPYLCLPDAAGDDDDAAVRLQKVYRSYRTRRLLADSAVVAEELWWEVLDSARLSHSTVSFFDNPKPESPVSHLRRVVLNASKVGKGLSLDGKAQKLAFQHWIEAIDPRHRYGHGLHYYYEEWINAESGQPFFYWLDIGDGKEVDLDEYPRSKLRHQCIKYLGPQERQHYEYDVVEGKIIHKQTRADLDTTKGKQGSKFIFVMSTSKKLYAGEKKKGSFHHSSFLAGGATLAAGRLEADNGYLMSISPYSGHYRPTEDSFESFLSFLRDNGVNLKEVKIKKANEESDTYEEGKSGMPELPMDKPDSFQLQEQETPDEEMVPTSKPPATEQPETKTEYKRTLSGGIKSPRTKVPPKAILQRLDSKKAAKSYQLGHQLTLKWSTGAGPRIGCIKDYPAELRLQALEYVNLSPRTPGTPSSYRRFAGLASPTTPLATPHS